MPDLQTGSRIFLDLNPKEEALAKGALTELAQADCHFLAGGQTADWLSKEGFVVERIEGEAALRECFSSQQVDVVVDTNDLLAEEVSEKEALRKLARDEGVAMLTAIDSFLAYCQTLTITVEEMESQALGE